MLSRLVSRHSCIISRTLSSFNMTDAGLLAWIPFRLMGDILLSRVIAGGNAMRVSILVRRGGMRIATRGMIYDADR